MAIHDHLTEFGGLPVQDWESGLPLAKDMAYRLALDWDAEGDWPTLLREFLAQPGSAAVEGMIVGAWTDSLSGEPPDAVVEALVGAAGQLPELRVLFLNDITAEECEISWLENTDISPLLAAYPNLRYLGIRGGHGLSLGHMEMPQLKHLLIQSSGLDASVVREVMNARLPALEHLELFVGDMGYGGDSTPEDLTPLLDGKLFPNLKYLGLKNSFFQSELAQMFAEAPVLDDLDVLDLSLGEIETEGLQALLKSEKVGRLNRLILRNVLDDDETLASLQAKLGARLEIDSPEGNNANDEWRYVLLGE